VRTQSLLTVFSYLSFLIYSKTEEKESGIFVVVKESNPKIPGSFPVPEFTGQTYIKTGLKESKIYREKNDFRQLPVVLFGAAETADGRWAPSGFGSIFSSWLVWQLSPSQQGSAFV